VRVPAQEDVSDVEGCPEFFDVRTGVQLREVHPPLQSTELNNAFLVADSVAESILKSGSATWLGPGVDLSKVVNIFEVRQRRLDSIVADSILDQVRVIRDLLQNLLDAAEGARPSERFWLSQQLLTFVRKFSGRELSEIEEMVDWFRRKPPG
jgi:hypothetical protein